jgi:hypothetical protein
MLPLFPLASVGRVQQLPADGLEAVLIIEHFLREARLVTSRRRPWPALSFSGSPGWIMDALASSVAGMTVPAVESDSALKPGE